MNIGNIKLTNNEIKSKNIILFITSLLNLLLGVSFFFSKHISFFDGCEIFYIVMLMYFGLEFTNYLLTKKITGMHYLYTSLACIIAAFSGFKYSNELSNMVISITLVGWSIIMLIIKLIKIEDLRNNSLVVVNIFTMSLFILLGFLTITNIYKEISNVNLMLGFFFTVNGILNFFDNLVNIKINS